MIYFGQDTLPFFTAAAIHEAGHLLAIIVVGKCEVEIALSAFGIAIEPKYRVLPKKREEIFILIMGPLAGIALALMLRGFSDKFFEVSMALSFINMLPLRGLDGGSVYRIISGEKRLFDAAAVFALGAVFWVTSIFCIKKDLPIWMAAGIFTLLLLRHIGSEE